MSKVLVAFLLLLICCCCNSSTKTATENESVTADSIINSSQKYLLYIGTYTNGDSKGIYKSIFNADSGKLSQPELVAPTNNPSFQCVSANHDLLWSVNESWSGTGEIVGYSINKENGNLKQISTFSSEGNAPCFVDYDENTGDIYTANYNTGNITKISVNSDGTASKASFTHQQKGKGPNSTRQEGPHAHCSVIDPTGKYIYSCNLGTDQIYVYSANCDSLCLIKTISVPAGSGPRHIAFHPELKTMEVINELNGTITTFLPDQQNIFSIFHHTISTLPTNFEKENKCADIHFTPNGKLLFASNRGHNSIAIYKFDEKNLTPVLVGWQTENCITTRNFAIDPTGKYLIAANQDANSVVVFRIDYETGKLFETGNVISISNPVCITINPIQND